MLSTVPAQGSSPSAIFDRRVSPQDSTSAAKAGMRPKASARATKSRGLPPPEARRAAIRSRSPIPSSTPPIRSLASSFAARTPTDWWRDCIALAHKRGSRSHSRNVRAPIGVVVRSTVPNKEPSRPPSTDEQTISRVLRVAASKTICS